MSERLNIHTRHGVRMREPVLQAFAGKNLGVQIQPTFFGQMFPSLASKPLIVSDQKLEKLAQAMKETESVGDGRDNPDIPAGFTYLGQFVDHDITLDLSGLGEKIDDPLAIENFRTPALDLDSVYGRGPGGSNIFYDRNDPDTAKLLIGKTTPVPPDVPGVFDNDLPRNVQGFALIGDHRNDENLLVAQTHLTFLKFHNKVIDHLRARPNTPKGDALFLEARRIVTWHYQWIVLFDFVERLAEKGIVGRIVQEGRKFYRFKVRPFMPLEFSAAAYRLGHSMVRQNYSHNRFFNPTGFNLLFLFSGLSGNINGQPPFVTLPSNWIIDWRRFFKVGGGAPDRFNDSRLIDPLLANELHDLPGGGGSLPFRNLKRGVLRKLPSGQDVAAFMKSKLPSLPAPLTPAEISTGPDGAAAKSVNLHTATPLWYYILKEAGQRAQGKHLGPYGARILAEVFVGIVQGDKDSFMSKPNWNPSKEAHPLPAAKSGLFTMADMLNFVGDLNPLGD